jgi:outer membrane protein assembly factor BamB
MRNKRFCVIFISLVCIVFFGKTGTALGVEWVHTFDDEYLTPGGPAIGEDGTIYVAQSIHEGGGEYDGNIYAYYPNGYFKWQFSVGTLVLYNPVIGDDGRIYFSTGYDLVALTPNGELDWSTSADCVFRTAPAIAEDGTIYIGANGPRFLAFNSDGSKKWEFPLPIGSYSGTPSIGKDGTIYFATETEYDNFLYAITPDGVHKWHKLISNPIKEPVIGYDGTIYALSYPYLYAFRASDGWLKWSHYPLMAGRSSPVAGLGGILWFGNGERLSAINTAGQIVWNSPSDYADTIYSTPAIDDEGHVYFGVNDGNFYILNPDGSPEWSFDTEDSVRSSAAITSDGYYSFSNLSTLFYMNAISNGPARTSWPLYRCNAKRNGRAPAWRLSIEDLRILKLDLVEYVDIGDQLYNSLNAKLESALKSHSKGQTGAAINKIGAFLNEVEAQAGKNIEEEDARSLIDLTMTVIY